ncbi:alkaline phosphatase family protein [Asinibacterium sp. OR53]|uniref:alkaline phosphatase family protein n=1 Tax=Asinibacterium sp. OR53 TaxID=925409 RepID=UPI0004BB9034|nr:alkaline phosphatase family protein [Asinibacterium sp. OR53]
MKAFFSACCMFLALGLAAQNTPAAHNVFIITTDGFRWQEVFNGADATLISDPELVKDTSLLKTAFWDADMEIRRRKLLPFFWNVIAQNGQLLGNRAYDNRVNVANLYKISYPGYNEILSGFADYRFIPNLTVRNRNQNILGYLNKQSAYAGRIAAFSSWNVMPYILDEKHNDFPVNSGYEMLDETTDTLHILINQVQRNIAGQSNTRHDMLTYESAKSYIEEKHPRVLFLGFGETDEFAHKGQYDTYLQKAHQVDMLIADLWYYVQTDPFYRNNTTFIITTDHGRGRGASWKGHGFWVKGSGETWIAMLGAGIAPLGEMKEKQQHHQKQVAATVSHLLGETFIATHNVAGPIALPKNQPQQTTGNEVVVSNHTTAIATADANK